MIAEARASPRIDLWEKAMNSELQNMLAAGTLTLVGSVPKGNNIVNTNFFF